MKKALHFALVLIGTLSFSVLFGQINHPGEPFNWSEKDLNNFSIHFNHLPAVDMDAIIAEDAVTDQYKETPYRFGIEHDVQVDFINQSIQESSSAQNIYRLGVHCPDAKSISFVFDRFDIPKGDQVFVYNSERTDFLGAFDHRNKNEIGGLAVGTLPYDEIIIEYIQNGNEIAELHINQIIHGYRSILNKWEDVDRGPFGSSGSCNINVNCPEGDAWQTEKKSVALIVSGGNAVCTGALVNNTAQDGTPYFLTANHCLGGNVNNWIFYFNHESSSCGGNSGPTTQSVSGSVIRANNEGSDFALLELNQTPPSGFNVQYAGWDRSDLENVTSAVGIHHPSGDVKKICFENNSPYHNTAAGAQVWWISQWEDGVTEGGSSGSPLFNQNHRIIGQLYGGLAACQGGGNNGQYDYYGRFGVSWDGGSASTRLRDWLDPIGLNPQVYDGWPIGAESFVLDGIVSPGNAEIGTICGDSFDPIVRIANQGTSNLTSATIFYTINGNEQSYSWTGNLEQYQFELIELPSVSLINGTNTLEVTLENPNDSEDENAINNSYSLEFIAYSGQVALYTLDLILDDYGSETTWEFNNDQGSSIYTGGPYDDDIDGTLVSEDICLTEGCYTFTIFDDFNDGICCNYGAGSYTLLNENNAELTTGGQFGGSASFEFCVETNNSIEDITELSFNVYPNPNNGLFAISWPRGSGQLKGQVIDNLGRTVKELSINAEDEFSTVNASELAPGVYFIRLFSEEYSANQRIIIR